MRAQSHSGVSRLSLEIPSRIRTADTTMTTSVYMKQRVSLAQTYYSQYNSIVFDDRLPGDLEVTWNKRMLKKAGQATLTNNKLKGTKTAKIELSEKVMAQLSFSYSIS